MHKQPPFTTRSGLQIGRYYQPTTKPYHDKDALRLQTALLHDREPGLIESLIARVIRPFWAWC